MNTHCRIAPRRHAFRNGIAQTRNPPCGGFRECCECGPGWPHMTAAELATARILPAAGSAMPPDMPPLDRGLGWFALDFRGHLLTRAPRCIEPRQCSKAKQNGRALSGRNVPPYPVELGRLFLTFSGLLFFPRRGRVDPIPGLQGVPPRTRRPAPTALRNAPDPLPGSSRTHGAARTPYPVHGGRRMAATAHTLLPSGATPAPLAPVTGIERRPKLPVGHPPRP